MKKYIAYILTVAFLFICAGSFAQKKKNKNNTNAPTPEQMLAWRDAYKQRLKDSVFLDNVKADTVAALTLQNEMKKMDIKNDKKLTQDDKDMQTGMLDEALDNKLKIILNNGEFANLQAYQARMKALQAKQEAEYKEQQNQIDNSPRNYGGYGGYGGYGRRY
jgi:hypothetical protein